MVIRNTKEFISERPVMVRPTLIVGLGGTGILMCRWVEQYIRELLGNVPSFIRFLKLDTDALEEGGPTTAGQSDFINLFHYMDMGAVVRDYHANPHLHPHLDWLRGLRLDAAFADYGCQGIPRLGRLAFAELRDTIIHEAVQTRFGDIRTACQRLQETESGNFVLAPDGAPAVHILSSVCGGTGAGMLIDMAYNARWWSRDSFPRSAEVIGHLVLPEAFQVDPMLTPKLDAVAGATLEQIEFLMDARRDDIPVRYRGSEEVRYFDKLTGPFNFLYLLNGQGDTGAGHRRHLTKMVARTLRSMTIEPLGQHVSSDANNKLNDVLGLIDPANGRIQCFASYGMWYGTPGHQHADLDGWIDSAFDAMRSKPGSSEATEETDTIDDSTELHLDVAAKAAGITLPEKSFSWDRPPSLSSDAAVLADVAKRLAAYLENTLVPHLRQQAVEEFPKGKPIEALLEVCDKMIEDDLFRAHMRPYSRVGEILNQWIEAISDWVVKERASATVDVKPVISKLKRDISNALDERTAELPASAWSSEDPQMVVKDLIDRCWTDLAESAIRNGMVRAVETTLEVFRLRKQALDSMPSLGKSVRATGTSIQRDQDIFSTPLYAANDPTSDLQSDLSRQFRQKLIRPVLRQMILDIDAPSEGGADIEVLKRKGAKAIRSVRDAKAAFIDFAAQNDYESFHHPVPSGMPVPEHEYYNPVCDVLRLAEPKIDLSRAGVYAQPLDVCIAQQVRGTCVPDLLGYTVGALFREANVTELYEKGDEDKPEVWFQLLRLRYGFSINAISAYDRYVEAASDYVTRRGIEYADLWLDMRWYTAYRAAIIRWQTHKKAGGSATSELDATTYNTVAAQIGECREQFRNAFGQMSNDLIRSMKDVPRAIRASEAKTKAEYRIAPVLDGLMPSEPEQVDLTIRQIEQQIVHASQRLELFRGLDGIQALLRDVSREHPQARQMSDQLEAVDLEINGILDLEPFESRTAGDSFLRSSERFLTFVGSIDELANDLGEPDRSSLRGMTDNCRTIVNHWVTKLGGGRKSVKKK